MALRWLGVYGLALTTFLVIDAVWLGVVAKGMYQREIGHLLAPTVRWGAAGVFYLLYVAGVLVLVVAPNLHRPLGTTIALGAVLGLVAYATYDLTNLATLTRWPLGVTLIDLAWGAFLTGVTATVGGAAAHWLVPGS